MDRATGQVHGNTIDLYVSLPKLDGQRVTVIIEPLEDPDRVPDNEESRMMWSQWCEDGPQGPIEDDGEPEFP